MAMNIEKPQILPIAEKSLNYCVRDCQWVPVSSRFIAVGEQPNGKGVIEIFKMSNSQNSNKYEIVSEGSIKTDNWIYTSTFDASPISDRHLAVGDCAGKITLHDLERLNSSTADTWQATHNSDKKVKIMSLAGCGGLNIGAGPNELASGGEDGVVKIWDIRSPSKAVMTINPKLQQSIESSNIPSLNNSASRACWALAFGNAFNETERALTCGYDNGDVRMIDLKMQKIYWKENVTNAIVGLEFDRRDIAMNKLVATTLEGNIHCWDCRTLSQSEENPNEFARVTEIPHTATAWKVRHLPQNRDLFMTTSASGKAFLWKYNYPTKRVSEDGKSGVPGELEMLQKSVLTTQPITGLDWHRDKLGLGVCSSLDQCVRIFVTSRLNEY